MGTSFIPHSKLAVPCHDLKKGSSWLLSLPYLSLQFSEVAQHFSEIAPPMMGSVIKVNQMTERQQMIQ